MRMDELKKLIKSANTLRKTKLFVKQNTGKKVSLWVYKDRERKTLNLPTLLINSKTTPEENALVRKAIDMRDKMENEVSLATAIKKRPISTVMEEWVNHYTMPLSKRGATLAVSKFTEANGDIPVGLVSRQSIIKTMDLMNKQKYHNNYVRNIASRLRAFCNWAEQRGYCNRVDTRKLLPAEQFGEIKALGEDEIKRLIETPCDSCPDVKDLFMLGVFTAQRTGEMKNYTFKMLQDGKIKTRQGKTGKFIIIPLSEAALSIMRDLKARREKEGCSTKENDKMFRLPSHVHVYRIFRKWLGAAGIDNNRITLHNSRSTAISLLINKGVPESVTQEIANHADPRITARYYRQIDDSRKKEALDRISEI